MPPATPVTVWESLQTEGTPVAGAILFIDPDTLQPAVDVDGLYYDPDLEEVNIKKLALEHAIAGSNGNITLNAVVCQVSFAAAAQSLTLTNDRIETDSLLICSVATDDATAKSAIGIVLSAGSATIKLNAVTTGVTKVNVWIIRKK